MATQNPNERGSKQSSPIDTSRKFEVVESGGAAGTEKEKA